MNGLFNSLNLRARIKLLFDGANLFCEASISIGHLDVFAANESGHFPVGKNGRLPQYFVVASTQFT